MITVFYFQGDATINFWKASLDRRTGVWFPWRLSELFTLTRKQAQILFVYFLAISAVLDLVEHKVFCPRNKVSKWSNWYRRSWPVSSSPDIWTPVLTFDPCPDVFVPPLSAPALTARRSAPGGSCTAPFQADTSWWFALTPSRQRERSTSTKATGSKVSQLVGDRLYPDVDDRFSYKKCMKI